MRTGQTTAAACKRKRDEEPATAPAPSNVSQARTGGREWLEKKRSTEEQAEAGAKFSLGDLVCAKHRSGKYYDAKIVSFDHRHVSGSLHYRIKWKDGEQGDNIKSEGHLKLIASEQAKTDTKKVLLSPEEQQAANAFCLEDDDDELDNEEDAGSVAMLAPKNPANKHSGMAVRVRENELEKDEEKAAPSNKTEKCDDQEQPNEEKEEKMSEYELKRLKRIEENKRLMIATGILQMTQDKSAAAKSRDMAEERRAVEIERKKNQFNANLEALREYGRQHGVFVFCLDNHVLSVLSESALVIGITRY